MNQNKLVVVKPAPGFESKTDPVNIQAYIDDLNQQTKDLYEKHDIEPGSLESTLLALVARATVMVSMISRELDEHGIHCVDVDFESEVTPQFGSLADLFQAIFGGNPGIIG